MSKKLTCSRLWAMVLAFVMVCSLLPMTALAADDTLPKEPTPSVTFEAAGPDTGTLYGLEIGGSYSIRGVVNEDFTASETSLSLFNVSAGTLSIVKRGDGETTANSDKQTITITRHPVPTDVITAACTTEANNDGKLLNVTEEMEYRLSSELGWTDGTGSDITDLSPGIYYIRVKPSGTALTSKTYTVMVAGHSAGTPYGITVNTVAVTSANKENVLGTSSGRVTYDPAESKLTVIGGGFDTDIYDLVIAANDTVDVEIDGGSAYAVNGNLTITGADDVTVTANTMGAPAIYGSADITCSGNVTIENLPIEGEAPAGSAVNGSLKVTGAKSVTVSAKSGSSTIGGTAEIDCSGNVNITNNGSGYAVASSLTVRSAADVTVTAADTGAPIIGGYADFICSGDVMIQGTGSPGTRLAVNGSLKVGNSEDTGAKNVTVWMATSNPMIIGAAKINCTGDVNITNTGTGMAMSSGGLTVYNADDVIVTSNPSSSPLISGVADITCIGNVTIENGTLENQQVTGSAVSGNLKVAGPEGTGAKNVTIRSKSGSPTITGIAEITCTGDVTIENVPAEGQENPGFALSGSLKVSGARNVTVSSASSGPTISGAAEIACSGDVSITNDGSSLAVASNLTILEADDVTVTATTSSASINGFAHITCTGNVTIKNEGSGSAVSGYPSGDLRVIGAKKVTVSSASSGPTISGAAEIACSGDVSITNTGTSAAIGLGLTVTNAKNVTVTAITESEYSSPPTIAGPAHIACTGNVTIKNEGSGLAVLDNLSVIGAKKVTVSANSDSPTISGAAEIICLGDVVISNTGTGIAINNGLTVRGADDVTVSASTSVAPAIFGNADIACTGNVTIENKDADEDQVTGFAVFGNLRVTGAKKVTVSSSSSYTTISGTADISSSGSVLIQNSGTNAAVYDALTYTPGAGVARYSVKTGDTEETLTVVAEKKGNEGYGPETSDKQIVRIVVVPATPPVEGGGVIDAHVHNFGTAWSADAGSHWLECTAGDGAISGKAAHADADKDGKCDVCGYAMPVAEAETEAEIPFTDVSASDWFHEDVQYVYNLGLMDGTSETTFAPSTATSRGMLVTMLYRLAGTPAVSGTSSFTDVAADAWFTDAVFWAAQNGIVSGYGAESFGPNDNITREQMVTILYNFAKHMGYDVSVGEDTNILSYDDAFDISEYAIPAMQWACGAGIINGTSDSTLSPKDGATRAQIAAIIHRFCEYVK